jgi:hypothetical protein
MVAERQLRSVVASPIEQAIDRVAEQQAVKPIVTLPLLDGIVLGPGSSIELTGGPDGVATILLVDTAQQGWHPIVMEPGSHWELREVGAKPDIWQPGKGGWRG